MLPAKSGPSVCCSLMINLCKLRWIMQNPVTDIGKTRMLVVTHAGVKVINMWDSGTVRLGVTGRNSLS